jgi:hypothetical protein
MGDHEMSHCQTKVINESVFQLKPLVTVGLHMFSPLWPYDLLDCIQLYIITSHFCHATDKSASPLLCELKRALYGIKCVPRIF